MAADTKVITAHVPLALAEKVEAMATRLERSRGWVMKQPTPAGAPQPSTKLFLLGASRVEVALWRL